MKFNGKWITTKDFIGAEIKDVFGKGVDEKTDLCNYHTYFKKSFILKELSGEYKIKISADDYYKLYINGSFVCQGPAPAYTSSYNYNEQDITRFLRRGENIVTVWVYYQGLYNRVWQSADNRQGLICDIFCGGELLLVSDKTWRYKVLSEFSGDTIGYLTAFNENIDFNLKDKNWKLSAPDENYCDACEKTDDDHIFKDAPTDTLAVYEAFPEMVVKLGKGEYFIDFGKEVTGQFYMKLKGKKGQKLIIKCGEETQEDNPLKARYEMRCNCKYIDVCTLSGGEDEVEFYDYKAFRYVNIETSAEHIDINSFKAIVRHWRFEERIKPKFKTENLMKVWRLCADTLKYGVQEGFLDCPTREKGQYTGDFTTSGYAHLLLTGDREIYKKTLFDIADTQQRCQGLLGVTSGSFEQTIGDFSLQFPLQVWNYYNYTNDKETLTELYPVIIKMLSHFEGYENGDGLIENCVKMWNVVDWPPNLRDGYCIEVSDTSDYIPVHNVINAHYIGAMKTTLKIEKALGVESALEKKCNKTVKAYLAAFYSETERLFYDDTEKTHSALHSNVLPVVFGIAPDESHETIKAMIIQKGLSCGTIFSIFVLKALSVLGAYKQEYELIINESEHSWINMLREGATTCYEAWGKEQKWNTSLCHPMGCSPIIAICEDLLDEAYNEIDF